ncbi:MAG: LysM peptidoglycan-binding domain-containing protein [Anaerolineae bacterium]
MTEDQTLRTLPDRPKRHCPECGARVADGAKICSICGTELPEAPVAEASVGGGDAADMAAAASSGTASESETESKRIQPLRVAILTLIAIVILSGSVVLGMSLSQGNAPAKFLPTLTPTPTNTPTITPTPTMTPTPTTTPTPTLTPTPIPPTEYVVQSGDTLLDIAMEYGLTVDEIIAFNELDSDIIVEGQILRLPAPTPTPGPTPTLEPGQPTATLAPFILHTVREGETLSTIAEQYNVGVDQIRAANDIPGNSETIQSNQVLTIPRNTPTPEPETVVVRETPTPATGLTRYPAPSMLYPPDGATFSGANAVVALQWASVGILEDREYYKVELLVPTTDGTSTLTAYLKSTVWRVPGEAFPPEAVEDRTLTWRVLVVRQVTEDADPDMIISQATRRRSFTWATD